MLRHHLREDLDDIGHAGFRSPVDVEAHKRRGECVMHQQVDVFCMALDVLGFRRVATDDNASAFVAKDVADPRFFRETVLREGHDLQVRRFDDRQQLGGRREFYGDGSAAKPF